MKLRSLWWSLAVVAVAAGCRSAQKDDGSAGKDIIDTLAPNFRASLAPGAFQVPLAFDTAAFTFDDAVLSLVCQGTRAFPVDAFLVRQTDETTPRNSKIAFTPDPGGKHVLSIVTRSKLSTKMHVDQTDQQAPCFVTIRTDLIAKSDDSRWRIFFSPRFPATEDGDGAATAQALQAALAAAPAMRFNTVMMGAGSTGKICAEPVEQCPWSASRLQQH
jgi:hypothetical protein